MSLLTVNDVTVISGQIVRPLSGVWSADLQIDQPDGTGFDAGTSVQIKADGCPTLTGIVAPARSGDFLDAVHVRIVGGKGGMGKPANARSFAQPGAYVRDVINALMSDAGETLSDTVDQSWLSQNLTAWSIMAGHSVASALNALIDVISPGVSWRVLADGTIWIGSETWTAATSEFEIIASDPTDSTHVLGLDAPWIEPGTALTDVGNVSRVEMKVDNEGVRAHVWVDLGDGDRGPGASIRGIVDRAIEHVDFFGLYECKVLGQSADLATVDVQPLAPVDKKLPGLQRVEVRAGTGIKIQFVSGAKVLLGWKGGDPTLPYVVPGLGADSFTSMQLGGTHPMPLWDTFLADFKTFITDLQNDLTAGGCTTTSTSFMAPKVLTGDSYKSQKVSNG